MEATGCATAGAICTCATAQNPRERPQVLPAYGLQDLRNNQQDPKTKSHPNTMRLQITLGENHGSGHFYLAKTRTFLLCVDTGELVRLVRRKDPHPARVRSDSRVFDRDAEGGSFLPNDSAERNGIAIAR